MTKAREIHDGRRVVGWYIMQAAKFSDWSGE